MKPRSNELAAGIFVLVALFLFLVFLAQVGGVLDNLFAEKARVVTYFRNIGALKEKVQVTFQGYNIGEVASIDYRSDLDLIEVTMDVVTKLDGDKPFVLAGRNAIAIVTQSTFLGDQYIEITTDLAHVPMERLVRGQPVIVEDKGILIVDAVDPSSIGMLMTAASGVLYDVKGLTEQFDTYGVQIGATLGNAQAATKGLKDVLGDPAFQTDIKLAASNARQATDDARLAMAKLPDALQEGKAMLAAGRRSMESVETMIADNRPRIDSMITNADELMLNARVLSYGLAESPWMLVWKDKEWQKRVQARDPKLLNASLRDPADIAAQESPVEDKSSFETTPGVYAAGAGYQFNVRGDL